MITPISSPHPVEVRQVSQAPAEVRRHPQAQTPPVAKSGQLSHDQVTLRSAGQRDVETGKK
jgi:hypothetical protein